MPHRLRVLADSIFGRQPTTTVLFVTNRCNLDCQMCFYTTRESRPELTVDEVERLAQSMPPQWYVMFTGGEPFLRRDIPELVDSFYDRGAANLHISTNCTLPERTISGVRRIAAHCAKARVIVVTSIDGPEVIHNGIRGANVFGKTIATIRKLLVLKQHFPNLAILANFTFTAANQSVWRETVDYLLNDVGVDGVNLGLVRGNVKEPATKKVDLGIYRLATQYLSSHNQRDYFPFPLDTLARFKESEQASLIYRIASGDVPAYHRCFAGRVFHVISETGEVFPCEMLENSLGNLRDIGMDFMALWRSGRAQQIRETIDRRECLCTYECAIGPSLATNPAIAGRFAAFLANKVAGV